MGYTFTWDDLEKVCLGMERHGKSSIWKGLLLFMPNTKV